MKGESFHRLLKEHGRSSPGPGVLEFRVSGFRVWGLGFRGLGFLMQQERVRGLGLRI